LFNYYSFYASPVERVENPQETFKTNFFFDDLDKVIQNQQKKRKKQFFFVVGLGLISWMIATLIFGFFIKSKDSQNSR